MTNTILTHTQRLALFLLGGLNLFGEDYGQLIFKNVTYESKCRVAELLGDSLLFLNYTISNQNKSEIEELSWGYSVEYELPSGARHVKSDDLVINAVTPGTPHHERVFLGSIKGKIADEKIISCSMWVVSYYYPIEIFKTRTVPVKTGQKIVVSPDCKADYTKVDLMKSGLERRAYLDKLIRLGCVSFQDVFLNRAERYTEIERFFVNHQKRSESKIE